MQLDRPFHTAPVIAYNFRSVADRRKSFGGLVENRPLYKNVMAIIALVAGLSGLIVGARTFLEKKPPEVVHDNTELIVDRSLGMRELWEGKTKLEVAQAAARSALGTIATGENLALRQFGGPCKGANTSLVVPFAQNNVKSVQHRVAAFSAAGDASLNNAINEAIGDFGDQKHFEGANKRILVITGSDDVCQDRDLLEAIGDKLASDAQGKYKIKLDFRFIGMGMNAAQRQNLSGLAELTGGKAVFANHPVDVEELLRNELKTATAPSASSAADAEKPPPGEAVKVPVRQDTHLLVDAVTGGVNHLNDALKDLEQGDFAAARAALEASRQDEKRSNAALASLGQGQRQEQFQELYQAASQCSTIHQKLLSLAEAMLKQFQTKDVKGYKVSSAEFVRLSAEFDRTAKQIDTLLARL
jgi:hypothetical protein